MVQRAQEGELANSKSRLGQLSPRWSEVSTQFTNLIQLLVPWLSSQFAYMYYTLHVYTYAYVCACMYMYYTYMRMYDLLLTSAVIAWQCLMEMATRFCKLYFGNLKKYMYVHTCTYVHTYVHTCTYTVCACSSY